jgi:hypothetical protein
MRLTFYATVRTTVAVVALLAIALLLPASGILGIAPAHASLTTDTFDGNIFPLYAGNGSLVPPRTTLDKSLKRSDRPTILSFYIDDSKDCKQYSSVLTQLDAYYGRAADLIFLSVDAIPPKESYEPTEPGYYYKGYVPQTMIFDQEGDIVFDEIGQAPFEAMDDVLREVFDLLPRSESVELRRRSINEVNTELIPEPK